ncbi:hypothetical protein F5884DRAFT_786385 [Xylogone sp. PMI_703]|nr:hypothetical protein F5884DRAFT_786385 [Xylogone sp. PMI_703]
MRGEIEESATRDNLRDRQRRFLGNIEFLPLQTGGHILNTNRPRVDSSVVDNDGGRSTNLEEGAADLQQRRRAQVLQAQRVHRQRTRDYIEALENEVLRLRQLEIKARTTAANWERCFHALVTQNASRPSVDLSAGQVAPGIFARNQGLPSGIPPSPNSPSISKIHRVEGPNTPSTAALLDNFLLYIIPTLDLMDNGSKGYADILLPLAYDNVMVRYALLAVSASYIRLSQPTIAVQALQFQSKAIEGLKYASISSSNNATSSASSLATILLLLINDMINGNKEFSTLMQLADTWITVNRYYFNRPNEPLNKFLLQQVQMLRLLVLPLYRFNTTFTDFDFMRGNPESGSSRASLNRSKLVTAFENLDSAVTQACDLYMQHTSSKRVQAADRALEALKSTVSKIPSNTPGEHVLVWIYFVAATKSQSDVHRSFFSVSLADLYNRLGLENLASSFQSLHKSWSAM